LLRFVSFYWFNFWTTNNLVTPNGNVPCGVLFLVFFEVAKQPQKTLKIK